MTLSSSKVILRRGLASIHLSPLAHGPFLERLNLNVPIYDGQRLVWRKTHATAEARELFKHGNDNGSPYYVSPQ